MDYLPDEIVIHICLFCNTKSILNLSETSSRYLRFRDELVCYNGNNRFRIIHKMISWKNIRKCLQTNVRVLTPINSIHNVNIIQGTIRVKGINVFDQRISNIIHSYIRRNVKRRVKITINLTKDIDGARWIDNDFDIFVKDSDAIVVVIDRMIYNWFGPSMMIFGTTKSEGYQLFSDIMILNILGKKIIVDVRLCVIMLTEILEAFSDDLYHFDAQKFKYLCSNLGIETIEDIDFGKSREIRRAMSKEARSFNTPESLPTEGLFHVFKQVLDGTGLRPSSDLEIIQTIIMHRFF